MIDDYYNIDHNGNSILKVFKNYFNADQEIFIHSYFGNEGVVFRYFTNNA